MSQVENAGNKGYCLLYFFMFLFCLFGAMYMAFDGNLNTLAK